VTLSGNNLTNEKVRTNSSFTSFGSSYNAGPPLWWNIKVGVHF
jgi:outer membrane receptor protein involved in Fe transport